MAAGVFAAPGAKFGPCKGSCSHIDCAATRKMAESLCARCQEPIGYGIRFYDVTGGEPESAKSNYTDVVGRPRFFAHAICEEDV